MYLLYLDRAQQDVKPTGVPLFDAGREHIARLESFYTLKFGAPGPTECPGTGSGAGRRHWSPLERPGPEAEANAEESSGAGRRLVAIEGNR